MEDVTVPVPNPFITQWLVGPECKRLVESKTHTAEMLYQAEVAKRSGDLARSSRVELYLGGRRHDRWEGALTVGNDLDYGASHEYGTQFQAGAQDLTVVLNQLGGF
jgi:hypothetical protein